MNNMDLMEKRRKWRFLSNQNSTIVGINDAGVETFTANMNRSLVREIIQNALDAVRRDNEGAVVVEFELFDMPVEYIPDVDNLKDAIRKCKESNVGEPDAFKYFLDAEELLSQQTVSVLRISDHNTNGLEGADTCQKGSSWSRLVKESGASNKGEGSGGSFGIGKAAAFACSDLRTVFYSSRDINGIESNIGVAKLVSFEDEGPGDWTTGVGYYSEDERFVAINELANFDYSYERCDSGTDIYIVGMHKTSNFKDEFIKAILLDFVVSLVRGNLVVKVQGELLDGNTIPKYMAMLNVYENEQVKNLVEYYHILTSSDPRIKVIKLDSDKYGKKYGFNDGECTLYLKEGEGLNRKIMITRKAGMRIIEQDRISGSIDFTGVLVIDGNNMSEAFKKMEVPSHDAFKPGRVRGEEKKYEKILSDLRKYLKLTVNELFGSVSSNSMDALGASDFLPDRSSSTDQESNQKSGLSIKIKELKKRVVEPTRQKSKAYDQIDTKEGNNEDNGLGHEQKSGKGGGTGSSSMNPNPKENQKSGNLGTDKGLKKVNVKKRLMCKNPSKGLYNLSMTVPTKHSEAILEFHLSGEQSDFELPILASSVLSEDAEIVAIQDNKLVLQGLKQGESLRIQVQIDFNECCMMEVDYYARKR